MREKVSSGFADYALKIELDRLQEIGDAIQNQYSLDGSWSFLPEDPQQKRVWINQELMRLYQIKNTAPTRHETVELAQQKSQEMSTTSKHKDSTNEYRKDFKTNQQNNVAAPASPVAPANPVAARVPVLPPLPPPPPPLPPPPPNELNAPPEEPDAAEAFASEEQLQSLNSRISLLDESENYLAGRPLDQNPRGKRPLYHQGEVIAYLSVQKSRIPSDDMAKDFLQQQAEMIITIIVISISLSGLAALLLALHFRRPIHQLAASARALEQGRFDTRIIVRRSDELGELANSFNQLAEKLAHAEQGRRQWVADTSHELRTPISVLRAQLEALQDGIRPVNSENIALMLRQVLSLNKLIDELYSLAKADVGTLQYQMQEMDIWTLIEEESNNFQDRVSKAELQLTLTASPQRSRIMGDSERLRQVIHNLLENSVRYTHRGGVIRISADSDQQFLLIHIEDTAPEVPHAALTRLGERFYRLDSSRSREHGGSGLGLALCSRISEAHQATIAFSASELGGLHVKLRFTLA